MDGGQSSALKIKAVLSTVFLGCLGRQFNCLPGNLEASAGHKAVAVENDQNLEHIQGTNFVRQVPLQRVLRNPTTGFFSFLTPPGFPLIRSIVLCWARFHYHRTSSRDVASVSDSSS